jgi:hypothetical protein
MISFTKTNGAEEEKIQQDTPDFRVPINAAEIDVQRRTEGRKRSESV